MYKVKITYIKGGKKEYFVETKDEADNVFKKAKKTMRTIFVERLKGE